jgi:hypothetical protein
LLFDEKWTNDLGTNGAGKSEDIKSQQVRQAIDHSAGRQPGVEQVPRAFSAPKEP